MCQQLAYFVFSGIFLMACKIGELPGSSQEYPAKSADSTLEKVRENIYQEFSQIV
jgi:hypothetical protein